MKLIVEVEEGTGIVRKVEAAALGRGSDLCNKRVGAKARVGEVEALHPFQELLPAFGGQRAVRFDLPAGSQCLEGPHQRGSIDL
jgi:hypothetical protein